LALALALEDKHKTAPLHYLHARNRRPRSGPLNQPELSAPAILPLALGALSLCESFHWEFLMTAMSKHI
jgi:hypothetical protein